MNQRARSLVLFLLRGYKWVLSPLLPPACRYVPSCSEYAMEAVDRYGVLARRPEGVVARAALSSFCAGRLRSGGEIEQLQRNAECGAARQSCGH